jgi:SsrA-binding protein
MSFDNKKAYFEYSILEEYVAGIKLLGSEVKSLRDGNASINDTYVYVDNNNEIFVKGIYIAKHKESSWMNHEESRDRKLLLTKKQIRDIQKDLKVNGITIVPISLYLVNGKFKLKIAIAKGKKTWNKKESLKEKDIKRQTERELNR